MKDYNILHISDMHLYDISKNSVEYLREDYYNTYLDKLIQLLKKNKLDVDYIIITGDFIDRYRHENFNHAKKIIKYLYNNLGLSDKEVGVCIGNHDLNSKARTIIKAREKYVIFSNEYINGIQSIAEGEFYKISKFNDEVAFISLDSTYKSKIGTPGILTDDDINKLAEDIVTSKINTVEIVVVCSHYPAIIFPNHPYPTELSWYDKHFWKTGNSLRLRIENILQDSRKIWLFGDTHQPGFWICNNSVYIMTGRFGTKIEKLNKSNIKYSTKVNRQVTHINISNNDVKTTLIQFYSKEHKESSQRGEWGLISNETCSYELVKPQIINEEIQDEICNRIVSKKLYRFGRFSTNEQYDLLGWIFVNDLLNNHFLLSSIVKSCYEDWLLKKNILNDTVTLLVGIDYWGSIIAAHLSILTCLQNLPIPSRNDRNHYSKAELLEHNKDLFEKKYSNIVIIIDVINTGKTVLKIIEDLREVLKLDKKCKFHCISVISDKMQKKEMSLSKLTTFGTLCGKLRQPIIAKDFLPPEEILARKEYFKD